MIAAQVIPVIEGGRVVNYLVNPLPCWPHHKSKPTRKAWSDEDCDVAVDMWLRGKSFGQIANALGRSRSAVSGFICRSGLSGLKGSIK